MVGVPGDPVGPEGDDDLRAASADQRLHPADALPVVHVRAAAIGVAEDAEVPDINGFERGPQLLMANRCGPLGRHRIDPGLAQRAVATTTRPPAVLAR